jgi:hypothetical protein
MPSKRYVCQLCSKPTTTLNALRHSRNRHILCPFCGCLASRVKHPCFGLKLLSRSALFKVAEPLTEGAPPISNIFIPIEIRVDVGSALRAILSGRELLDTDVYTPALFLLAKLRRTCLGCLNPLLGRPSASDPDPDLDLPSFHTCRSTLAATIDTFGELACNLFNIQNTPQVHKFFTVYLTEHSFD